MNTAVDKYTSSKARSLPGRIRTQNTCGTRCTRGGFSKALPLKSSTSPAPFRWPTFQNKAASATMRRTTVNRLETMLLCEVTGMIAGRLEWTPRPALSRYSRSIVACHLERHAGVRIRWQNPQSRMAVKLTCWQRLDARLRYAAQRGIVF